MKTPENKIEKAKTMLEDYKQRVIKSEHFTTWEEFEKKLNFTEKETKQMNKKIQKVVAKIDKKNEDIQEKTTATI